MVQVVKHHKIDEIVGVHMVGPRVADMIPEATLAVKFGLTVDDIIDTIHPFPPFSEAFRRDVSTMGCCVEPALLVSGEYVVESPGLAQIQECSIE